MCLLCDCAFLVALKYVFKNIKKKEKKVGLDAGALRTKTLFSCLILRILRTPFSAFCSLSLQ